MQEESSSDKRHFARFPVKLSARFLNMYSNRWRLVKTHDVSLRGVGLFTDEQLAPDTSLEIWLPIPDKGETLYAWGNVAWSKMVEPDKYRTGVNLGGTDLSEVIQALKE
ncbi:MAG: hypothetical protein DRP74_00850 [Candidatus Omnitrophota bacterium]|nr:MAG: hypothetical protein DRP74_00850 [Candidatus Omnitrophota bacterium]